MVRVPSCLLEETYYFSNRKYGSTTYLFKFYIKFRFMTLALHLLSLGFLFINFSNDNSRTPQRIVLKLFLCGTVLFFTLGWERENCHLFDSFCYFVGFWT